MLNPGYLLSPSHSNFTANSFRHLVVSITIWLNSVPLLEEWYSACLLNTFKGAQCTIRLCAIALCYSHSLFNDYKQPIYLLTILGEPYLVFS